MFVSKKLTSLKEQLEVDLQLIACELDTSVKNMRFLSSVILEEAVCIDCFNKLCEEIENTEDCHQVLDFDDNTVLYEFLEESIVIHTNLGIKYIIFDSLVTAKIENRMDSYR